MRSAWIVVANASRARLFERVSERGHIEPLASIEESAAAQCEPTQALTSGGDDPCERVARRVASFVNDGVQNDRCARLQVFATVRILGAIREHMHRDTMRVSAEHATGDLTGFSTEELEIRIAALCAMPFSDVR